MLTYADVCHIAKADVNAEDSVGFITDACDIVECDMLALCE